MKTETCFSCKHFILSEAPDIVYICNAKATINKNISMYFGLIGHCKYYFAKDVKDLFVMVSKIAQNVPVKSRLA